MLNYAVGSIYLGKRDHEFASGFLRSHHWRSLEFLFSRNVESFTSLHVGSFWMIPGENIILREASAADCLPRLDNRLECTLLDCHGGTGTMRYTYRAHIPVTA